MNKKTLFFLLILFTSSLFADEPVKIVILHTNDTHSQVEPVPGSDLGGYARRLGVINQIRSEEEHVVLLDAGDFFQGTPYFNFFNGRIEAHALEMMQYDAITFGNHEFDNGIDTLVAVLNEVKLPIVVSNYDVSRTPLKKIIKPYKIIKRGGIKIGVFGLGVDLEGLTFKSNYNNMHYIDPIIVANNVATKLKKKGCDVVVCLSHLGATTADQHKKTDYDIAEASSDIDVIIGGHSHTMLVDQWAENAAGRKIRVAQMGKSGLNLGRIDLYFEKRY